MKDTKYQNTEREGNEKTTTKAWCSRQWIGLQILPPVGSGPSLKGFEQEMEAGQAGGRT